MRNCGILMHITSLPGPYGVGTMGKQAFAFVDFLKDAGQKKWQILPLTPTGYGDSPYQSCSAYAGNHYLIDLDLLVEQGLFEEVRGLLDRGLTESDISMKGIGYKEIIGFYHGQYNRDEAIDLIKKNTRHLAKRQLTWFRRYEDMRWLDISEFRSDEEAIKEMITWLKNR